MDGISSLAVLATSVAILLISYVYYAIYLHPLRDFPGPKLSAVTRIPYWIVCLRGIQPRYMIQLHETYGPVVRFAPDDLSYTDGRAWKDISGAQKGRRENGKEVGFHAPPCNGTPNLVTENDEERHAAIRRVFSPAFSEKALKKQEPMFHRYADLMVQKGRAAGTVNMTELLNWATFDIMADFAFGESLGLLEKGAYSAWIAVVFNTVRVRCLGGRVVWGFARLIPCPGPPICPDDPVLSAFEKDFRSLGAQVGRRDAPGPFQSYRGTR